ncbi:hypothetical protein [Rhodococcoides yunnanense]|jgi:hypothetical protein|uniref:hypothetical protein n=1 Tax=Rhodococcoides yunnanense TaxID=278209 RepID=UPI0022B1C716|nr:hypothetical protein [Rhodococcus yunnanensis]MCZ4275091.1 hypothetical protein [Rhodococcus yunnanensis]
MTNAKDIESNNADHRSDDELVLAPGTTRLPGFGTREANEIVGTTDAENHRQALAERAGRESRRAAEQDRERASGIGVSPTLDHEFGQRLTDGLLKGIRRNAAAARKIEHRLDEEFEHLTSLAAGQRDGELLAAAWDAAQAKAKVPGIMVPALEFDRSAIPTTHPIARRKLLLDKMHGHWAFENRESVLAVWAELEQVLGEESTSILDESVRAYRLLIEATGETGNANAVIANKQPDVLDAFEQWPGLVERWRQVQCVRQWLALVQNNGFREDHPESLIRTDAQVVEQEVWRSQFVAQCGVQIAHVDTPDSALQWFADTQMVGEPNGFIHTRGPGEGLPVSAEEQQR